MNRSPYWGTALLCAALIPAPAHGDLLTWIGSASTDFLDPMNWDLGHPPGPDDSCLVPASSGIGDELHLAALTSVTIDSIVFNQPFSELMLENGSEFIADPASVSAPGLTVANDGHAAVLELAGGFGSSSSILRSRSCVIGDDTNALGALDVRYGVDLDVQSDLIIGREGRGRLTTALGSDVAISVGRLDIASGPLAVGMVDSRSSHWTIADAMRVGIRGIAFVEGRGMNVQARTLDVAVQPSSVGTMIVGGETFVIDTTARIGVLGRGEVVIEDSSLEIGADLVLGAAQDEFDPTVSGDGRLVLRGAAHATVDRDLWLGMFGSGVIELEDAASLRINRSLRSFAPADGALVLRPSASMSQPMVTVIDAMNPIEVHIDLSSGHDLEIGSTQTLISAAGGLENATLALLEHPVSMDRRFTIVRSDTELLLQVTATADLNADGSVDYDDLLLIIAHWGPCLTTPCATDLTGDATTDFNDLIRVLGAWTS